MIKQQIQKQILTSLKEKNSSRLNALRYVLSQINYEEINKQHELSDEETISVIQKEVKKRREAMEMFKRGGRTENIAEEETQIKILNEFLPEELSDSELEKIIDRAMQDAGENKQTGKIIGMVMNQIKGRAKGERIAEIVKRRLSA